MASAAQTTQTKDDPSSLRKRGTGAQGIDMSKQAEVQTIAFESKGETNLTGEYGNICLLIVLYVLQGIPMGLGKAIPMILKERGATYSELGTYSFQSLPFSLKLLWAPLVDTLYIQRFGRRKTWMVPAQLLIGAIMIYSSAHLDSLLYGDKPAVLTLLLLFLSMNFLCATQDIAVDGWALTMLRKDNAAYQATCNAVGQTLGATLGWTGVTLLEHMRLINLSGSMFYIGIIFIVVTILVCIFKQEEAMSKDAEPEGIVEAYGSIFSMLKLKPVRTVIMVLFTWKLGFAVVDSVAPLKFQEHGVPKEYMTYMNSLLMPLEIMLPVLASKWTCGPMPFNLALSAYRFKVAIVPLTAILVYVTPSMNPFPWGYWMAMMAVALVGSVTTEWMFVSQIALFAKVSDPAIGGTYMSFLNTMGNLGQKLPPTATFFLVDFLTCRQESCLFKADGFYIMTAICTVLAIVWYLLAAEPVRRMQLRDISEWRVGSKKNE
eukprot:TRINITY_DN6279_c0_g1_i2.p1 TRINITY_DN6279_c0_g1~~TRINITY_DN6279_c0_g1_i2.p1  ORF type:complete len:500 (-),score=51.77 TRINITY_DN6279_c0_g1_i2:203-1669(-)